MSRIKDPKRKRLADKKKYSCKYYQYHSASCVAPGKKIINCFACTTYKSRFGDDRDEYGEIRK